MNDDVVLDYFFYEMDKIAFNLKGLSNAMVQTSKKMKGQMVESLGGAAKASKGQIFTTSTNLAEGKGAKMALQSADDLANLGSQRIATSVDGVGGSVTGSQLKRKVSTRAQKLQRENMAAQLDEAVAGLNLNPAQKKALQKRLKERAKAGEALTPDDIKQTLVQQNLDTLPANQGMADLTANQNINRMVDNANLKSIQAGDATEEALKQVKAELGLADEIMTGTKADFTEQVILNPQAKESMELGDLLTYGGINALGFAGKNAETIAKGSAIGLGGLGLYSIL